MKAIKRRRAEPVAASLHLSGKVIALRRGGVILSERFFGARTEGMHAARAIERLRHVVSFEVEASLVDDAEEGGPLVEAIPAEHGFPCEFRHLTELIQDEVFEAVVAHASRLIGWTAAHVGRIDSAHSAPMTQLFQLPGGEGFRCVSRGWSSFEAQV